VTVRVASWSKRFSTVWGLLFRNQTKPEVRGCGKR
jgi:hypothetical protein